MAQQTQMRMTRQRSVILEELQRTRRHPTADQVYRRVRRRLPRISLATVYRNLELMADRGLIRKTAPGVGPRRFDGETAPHHHARCLQCGAMADAPAGALGECGPHAGDVAGFEIVDYRLELLGYCPKCRSEHGRTP